MFTPAKPFASVTRACIVEGSFRRFDMLIRPTFTVVSVPLREARVYFVGTRCTFPPLAVMVEP